MSEHRNQILIGQVEEIDLLQPQVRAMLDNPGIYVGADSKVPGVLVPLVSQQGKVFSVVLDNELNPERFLPTVTLAGPFLPEDRWQPIETAPKSKADGTRVEGIYLLGFVPDEDFVDPASVVKIIWWEPLLPNSRGGRGKWCSDGACGDDAIEVKPTLWRPLGPLPVKGVDYV